MKKIFVIISLFAFPAASLFSATAFQPGTLPLVDGIYNSTQAVITGRLPVFSWEFDHDMVTRFFIVEVNFESDFKAESEIWNYTGSTTAANTINFITRVKYDEDGVATPLSAGAKYYWKVVIYSLDGTSAEASGEFTTVSSVAELSGPKLDLFVDWNNPFSPASGEVTKFRFSSKDRDRKVKLRIFTLSGELVRQWAEQTAIAEAWYTIEWNGKNDNNETVARGIYLANLADVSEAVNITRRVAVIK